MPFVYPALVTGPNDINGALAYIIYKRIKIEWREQYVSKHGRQPSAAEEAEFIDNQLLPENLALLKQRGEQLAATFAQKALEDKITAIALEVSQSELTTSFSGLQSEVRASLARIEQRFDEKKGWTGWLKDVATAFAASLLLIAFVGVLVTGYVSLAGANTIVERLFGINVEARQNELRTRAQGGAAAVQEQAADRAHAASASAASAKSQ